MATEVRLRRGTAAEHEVFAGAPAEVTVDTTNNTLRVHDGETLGGHETMPRGILPSPIVPDTFLQAKADGSGYEAKTAAQVLEAIHALPAGRYEFDLPLTAIADEPSPLGYKSEPQLVYCADGSILCVYRRGSSHIANDGRIVAKRSTDLGRTWGAEIEVHNQPLYDTRNPTVGIDPDSGRLIVFSRTLEGLRIHRDLYFQTSDDNGASWSAATNISSLFSGTGATALAPFGPAVQTANGLMQLIYGFDDTREHQWCWAIFSTDGGLTWGGRTTVYDLTQVSTTFTEPFPVRLDNNRIVVLIRNNKLGNEYWFVKSSDGGLTWTSATGQRVKWTSDDIAHYSPAVGAAIGGSDVLISWNSRGEPDGSGYVYTVRMNREVFFHNPASAFVPGGEPRRRVAVSIIQDTAPGPGPWPDFGYPFLLPVPGVQHTALIAWYDSKNHAYNEETDIWITTLPR